MEKFEGIISCFTFVGLTFYIGIGLIVLVDYITSYIKKKKYEKTEEYKRTHEYLKRFMK